MEFEKGVSGDRDKLVDDLVATALRLKWILIPVLVGIVCGLGGLLIGDLLGAILVSYMLIMFAVSGIGLLGITALKAYERRK